VLNKVIYLEIVSDTAAYNRYRASELHYTTYPLEQYQQIKRQSPEELVSAPMLATYYYVFNTQRKPFDDVRVRKAPLLPSTGHHHGEDPGTGAAPPSA
jgi:oligopeptide transport system substrate-binding protein